MLKFFETASEVGLFCRQIGVDTPTISLIYTPAYKELGSTAFLKYTQMHETACAKIVDFHGCCGGKWGSGGLPKKFFQGNAL